MQEETKEDFLRRHRKALGIDPAVEDGVEDDEERRSYRAYFKRLAFIVMLLAFICGIYYMFGMMKGN